MSIRDDFAAALSTVDGVRGFPKRPAAVNSGDAWPLLSSLDRGEGFTFIASWRVILVLPQDEVAASDWIDAHAFEVADALEPVSFVDRLEPIKLPVTNSGELFALEITMRGEQ